MTVVKKVKIESFVAASRAYLEKNLDKVNTTGSKTTIRATEAKNLPKDLRDNYARLAPDGKAMKKSELVSGYMKEMTAALKKADGNKDGYLTLTEGKKLPAHVRDNFLNYANAGSDFAAPKVKDTTPKLLIAAHQAEYGTSPVGYADAFKKGIDQVMKDEENGETPRALLKYFAEEDGTPLTSAQLDAKMKKLFKGMELLPVGEASESGGDPAEDWIFSVDLDAGSDHGFWVSVSRKTGEAFVNGFN
jgi:hypothetical protein